MDCHSIFERLSADLDRELPADEAAAVRHHLLSCAECARTRSQLEKARSAFRAIALEPVGDNFDDAVFRRLSDGHQLRRWLPAVAGIAAALAIVLVLRAPRTVPAIVSGPSAPSFVSVDLPPGWSDGPAEAAADCARSAAVVCHVETPCADGGCRSAAVAAFTDSR